MWPASEVSASDTASWELVLRTRTAEGRRAADAARAVELVEQALRTALPGLSWGGRRPQSELMTADIRVHVQILHVTGYQGYLDADLIISTLSRNVRASQAQIFNFRATM